MRNKIGKLTLVAFAVMLLVLSACAPGGATGRENRRFAVTFREEVFSQARTLHPEPRPQNFPLRQALVKFTEREDLINHPWYVYILGMNGNVIGYYVAQTVPVNSCTFLSSTEELSNEGAILTAPSLDGIFYGGAGSASGCDEWFFFDAETDALIKIRGVFFYVADQPLLLEAEPILVQQVK